MREIKFRAWDKINKRWLNLFKIVFNEGVSAVEDLEGEMYGLHQVELMQFTGLKDCEGVDIYEGDILKINDIYRDDDGAEFTENHISIVEWNEKHARFIVNLKEDGEYYYSGINDFYEFDFDDIEVIGNVFENPELVKDRMGD